MDKFAAYTLHRAAERQERMERILRRKQDLQDKRLQAAASELITRPVPVDVIRKVKQFASYQAPDNALRKTPSVNRRLTRVKADQNVPKENQVAAMTMIPMSARREAVPLKSVTDNMKLNMPEAQRATNLYKIPASKRSV